VKISFLRLIAVAVLLVPTLLVSSGSASAAPENCVAHMNTDEDIGYTTCQGGNGYHRVQIACYTYTAPVTYDIYYGPWVAASQVSTADCPWYEYIVLAGVNLQY